MTAVPDGQVWALSTVGSKRHLRRDGYSLCNRFIEVGLSYNTPAVMRHEACRRCLVALAGQK